MDTGRTLSDSLRHLPAAIAVTSAKGRRSLVLLDRRSQAANAYVAWRSRCWCVAVAELAARQPLDPKLVRQHRGWPRRSEPADAE